jgi:hypothetical protein
MNPENCLSCKIPDPTCIPTGTYKTVQQFYDAGNQYGICGIQLMPGMTQQNPNAGPYYVGCYSLTGVNSTANVINWQLATLLNGQVPSGALYGNIRLVSASITAEFVGNTGTDQGFAVGYWFAPVDDDQNDITTLNQAMQSPYSQTFPIRNGCRVLWRPKDNEDLEFINHGSPALQDDPLKDRPVIGILCGGLATGSQIIFTITCNWEAIPRTTSTSLVNAQSSPTNIDWINKGLKWGQNIVNMISPLYQANSAFRANASQLMGAVARNYLTGVNILSTTNKLARLTM